MKTIVKGPEPEELGQFRARYEQRPTPPKWKEFNSSRRRRDPVVNQLRTDQGGICAYCEIDLIPADESVEHFVPAHLTTREEDWDFPWDNLLLICKGGDDASLAEEGDYRFEPPPSDECCCGASKDDSTDPILNPLQVDPAACLFRVGITSGGLSPNSSHCDDFDIDQDLVQHSIDLFNLNCGRLARNRLVVIETLAEEAEKIGDEELARIHLSRDCNGCWPPFFTTYRSFLGDAAEVVLRQTPEFP